MSKSFGAMSVAQLSVLIQAGAADPVAVAEAVFDAIANNADTAVFTTLLEDRAMEEARASSERLRQGRSLGLLDGIPIAWKDLFDIEGVTTTAGSRVLAGDAPAKRDAAVVGLLKNAGMIAVGRTNMSEFAFSGLGINPHYGTPANPYDRKAGRIPGGSSSGAAVSVADGMAFGGLGTDTGGSCRIPAALCGVVGLKPTAYRVPTDGAFPLSTTLDSIGPLAATVECCAVLDAVLAGEPVVDLARFPLEALRLAVPQTMVLDNAEPAVTRAFDAALAALRKAGAGITDIPLRELSELQQINSKGGLASAESYAIHRGVIAAHEKEYDPEVLVRIVRGREQDAADYIDLVKARADFIRRVAAITAPYDALVMPTTPLTAPRIADLKASDAYRRTNMLMLRNPSIANFIDGCAISLPCHRAGEAPVGLMLFGAHGTDRRLLSIAAAIEQVVSPAVN